MSAHEAEDVFGIAPDYFLARTRFASAKYVWGAMFDGIRDVHGSLGLNYKSFSDPYGYISTLQAYVFLNFCLLRWHRCSHTIKKGKIKERVAGLYLSKKGAGELTLGGYNPDRVNAVKYFKAYDYNGMWELSITTVKYKDTVNQVYERRALVMLHVPFLIIPERIFTLFFLHATSNKVTKM